MGIECSIFCRMVGSKGSIEHARNQKFAFSSSSISAIRFACISYMNCISIIDYNTNNVVSHEAQERTAKRTGEERRRKLNKLIRSHSVHGLQPKRLVIYHNYTQHQARIFSAFNMKT
ncbi:hypothetical protein GQ55_9G419700 [Panicum hallii var. hallii]|uniref:Uncharacterized protein n=1 Tax=Panicum hallii var. hallii TaxID=1504633 RepID=A0A2T7CAM7_9POAL|nr:hypothetical protein GQ55_9G419700 [Panicum hallii var. hallii]